MRAIFLLAAASVCFTATTATAQPLILAGVTASGRVPVTGAFQGQGRILSTSVDPATLHVVFINHETGTYSGSVNGNYAYPLDHPERAELDPLTAAGTYERLINVTGTVNGIPCSFTFKEVGTVDFVFLTVHGNWKIQNATCHVHGSGTLDGQLAFTGADTYNISGTYSGFVKF
jgi:hypothetical protein